MNDPILSLLGDLYSQVTALQQQLQQAHAVLAEVTEERDHLISARQTEGG